METMSTNVMKGLLLLIALVAIGVVFVRFNRVTLPEGAVPVVWTARFAGTVRCTSATRGLPHSFRRPPAMS